MVCALPAPATVDPALMAPTVQQWLSAPTFAATEGNVIGGAAFVLKAILAMIVPARWPVLTIAVARVFVASDSAPASTSSTASTVPSGSPVPPRRVAMSAVATGRAMRASAPACPATVVQAVTRLRSHAKTRAATMESVCKTFASAQVDGPRMTVVNRLLQEVVLLLLPLLKKNPTTARIW